MRDDGLHRVRVLCEHRAHEQAAVAAAFHGKFLRLGVVRFHEPFSARREVIEDVLLVREAAGRVPPLAELISTAQIRNDQHAALIEPHPACEIETGREADAVAAVAVKHRGIFPVQAGALLLDDRHRHARPVLRLHAHARRLDVRERRGRCALERGGLGGLRVLVRIEARPVKRLGVRLRAEQHFIAVRHDEAAHRGRGPRIGTTATSAADPTRPASATRPVQLVIQKIPIRKLLRAAARINQRHAARCGFEVCDHVRGLRDVCPRQRQIRLAQLHAQNLSTRRALGGEQIERIVATQFEVERVAPELDALHLILEARDLLPLALRVA